MRLFGWFRRMQGPAESAARAPICWQWLSGHRMITDSPYILPKDAAEGGRLEMQHFLFKLAAGGNYRAPLRYPGAILDVACGTGIWGRELAREFPQAQVVGFDLDRTPLEAARNALGPGGQFPANFRFLEADALQPFPFADHAFDYSFARLISPFVPQQDWPRVVAEMVRVTKPGEYVELVDAGFPTSPSPAYTRIAAAGKALMGHRGLHLGAGPYLAQYLQEAGLVRAKSWHAPLSGGRGRRGTSQQRLLVADLLAAGATMAPILVKLGYFPEEECTRLLQQEREELPSMGIEWEASWAEGMKPLPAHPAHAPLEDAISSPNRGASREAKGRGFPDAASKHAAPTFDLVVSRRCFRSDCRLMSRCA